MLGLGDFGGLVITIDIHYTKYMIDNGCPDSAGFLLVHYRFIEIICKQFLIIVFLGEIWFTHQKIWKKILGEKCRI